MQEIYRVVCPFVSSDGSRYYTSVYFDNIRAAREFVLDNNLLICPLETISVNHESFIMSEDSYEKRD